MAGERDHPTRSGWMRASALVGGLLLSWLLMQLLHEAGHVLHAWASGGAVERVELHPLRFSRTVLAANPRPQLVAWGGPVWGCLLPLGAWLLARRAGPGADVAGRVLVSFCCVANAIYVGTGPMTWAGDAGDLLLSGAPAWALVAFGLLAFGGGLALGWDLPERLRRVTPSGRAVAIVWGAAFGLAVLEVAALG